MDRRIRVITEKTGTQYTLLFPVKPSKIKGLQGCTPVYFPIWWYVAPTIINTFLEQYDLKGKTVVPFATSGMSGMGSTNKELKSSCPGANLKEGRRFANNISKEKLKAWAEKMM